MPNQITISQTSIPVDSDNRINLNALHRASATSKSKAPNEWMRTKQAQELIVEFESQTGDLRLAPISKQRGGATPGTFAHELLAISYAGWISPKFQLEVNRVFLDTKRKVNTEPQLLDYKPDRNVPISDLIYEIAQLRGVSTEQVRIHYSSVFNSQDWTKENEFIAAAARTVLRRDMQEELENTSPDMRHLLAMAKLKGLRLVNESDYQSFQARLELQQQEIEKLIDEMMRVSRNHRSLSIHSLWS